VILERVLTAQGDVERCNRAALHHGRSSRRNHGFATAMLSVNCFASAIH
jgi:hypothetical protein